MAEHEVDDAPRREEFAAQRADHDRTLAAMQCRTFADAQA